MLFHGRQNTQVSLCTAVVVVGNVCMQRLFTEGLLDAGKNYQDAVAKNNTTQQEGGDAKYSLREFEDGARFVDVQMDAHEFDGLTVAEMNRKAKAILTEKFAGKVIGIDNRVFVNGDSVNEYLHPSKSIEIDLRKAKLAASGELDNLLDAGIALPNQPDGKDGHVHPDAIDFSYFKTTFKIGSEYFEGIVNVKNIKRGKLLKDVTKIRNITEDVVSSYGQNPKSNFLRDASMDSIHSPSQNVKEKSAAKENTTQGGGKKYSLRLKYTDGHTEELADARNLTKEQALDYLHQAKTGEIRRESYIPVRKDTPQVLIDALAQVNEKIENRSLVMQVHKAQQAMSSPRVNKGGRKHGKNVRNHGLSESQIIEIMDNLDNPSEIVYQTNRFDEFGNPLPNNIAVFVEYGDGENVAVIEFDSTMGAGTVGTEFGDLKYHTVVTVFQPDAARNGFDYDYVEVLLSDPNNFALGK